MVLQSEVASLVRDGIGWSAILLRILRGFTSPCRTRRNVTMDYGVAYITPPLQTKIKYRTGDTLIVSGCARCA